MPTAVTGFTSTTANHLLLDAGAFYRDFDMDTLLGTLIGATKGGGEFSAKPTVRDIAVDGVKGKAKGLQRIDTWDISIKANMLEITPEVLKAALASGNIDSTDPSFDIVTANNDIALADYIDNITWVGRLSGSSNPVFIQIFNALNTEGITLATADKNEGVIPITFMAHYDAAALDDVPFAIYYPNLTGDTTAPTVTVVPDDAAVDVVVSVNVVWSFSEAIQSQLVTSANFFVMKASDGTLVPGALTISLDKETVTFNPTDNLTAATAYIAISTTNVKDLAGNALAVNSVTGFTTAA